MAAGPMFIAAKDDDASVRERGKEAPAAESASVLETERRIQNALRSTLSAHEPFNQRPRRANRTTVGATTASLQGDHTSVVMFLPSRVDREER